MGPDRTSFTSNSFDSDWTEGLVQAIVGMQKTCRFLNLSSLSLFEGLKTRLIQGRFLRLICPEKFRDLKGY